MNDVCAIILAAGYSSRMSAFKPLLPVGGETALTRAVRILKDAGVHHIVAVTGHRHGEVEDALPAGVQAVHNPRYSEGMFTSVIAGVAALPDTCGAFFLLPVDCAAASAQVLTQLMREYDGRRVLYPQYGGRRGHPPLIPYNLVKRLAEYDGRDGMRGFLSDLPGAEVSVSDRGVLLDMDTPADYAALLAHLGIPAYPSKEQCGALLQKYKTPENVVAHCAEVALTAQRIAHMAQTGGASLDEALIFASAMLHDMMRTEPEHAVRGAQALIEEGYPRAAQIVAVHMDMPEDIGSVPEEALIVYLADKLSRRGGVTPLSQTLQGFKNRPGGAFDAAFRRLKTADSIIAHLHSRYGADLREYRL